ncbi:MAG: hypothetical protein PHE21_02835 [Candidatus Dojkabacteria bacterium]|nr:hypothetical protein [Candidatus Dojkabacteria bacterium]
MRTLKLLLISLTVFFSLSILFSSKVKADTEGTVTATITIGVVSVTVAPTSFDYGTMPFSSTAESFDIIDEEGDKNIESTVGTLVTDLDIKGASTVAWTLSDTAIGENQYMHKFGDATDSTTRPASYTALTTGYDNDLADDVAASGSVWFGLEIHSPSSGTTTQQSAVVTVLASWAG